MNEEKIMSDYSKMYQLFQEGKIDEEAWNCYCARVLKVLMINNHDILMRLKYV